MYYSRKGPRNIIAGPQLWRRSSFLHFSKICNLEKVFVSTLSVRKFVPSFDQSRCRHTVVFEGGNINYQKFKARHRNYGYGDYEFYE